MDKIDYILTGIAGFIALVIGMQIGIEKYCSSLVYSIS